jgi:Pro-kumamolisin, activation domain
MTSRQGGSRMTIRRASLVAVSLVVAVLVAASPAGATVPGTSAWRVKGARNLGAMGARRMTITFALAPRDPAGLRALVSSPHAAITPAQFTARFGPSSQTVRSIRRWAKAHRLRVVSVSPNRMLVGSPAPRNRSLAPCTPAFVRSARRPPGGSSRSPARRGCRRRLRQGERGRRTVKPSQASPPHPKPRSATGWARSSGR